MNRALSLCTVLLLLAGCAATEAERRTAAAPLPWCNPCTSPCTPGCAAPMAAKPAPAPAPAPTPAPAPVAVPAPARAIAPAFDPAPGDYPAAQSVMLSTPTPGASIHYTTDGSEPTAASPVYSAPIQVERATTIRALAVAPDAPASAVSAGAYGIAPPPPPARVVVTAKKVELKEKIFFDTSKATIKPVSFELLDEAAQVLNAHPEVKKLTIEGHTDSTGAAAANQALSQARAEAVRDYLVKKGVAADRLSAKGYGATRPIGENKTAAGRDANRRVELTIE
jgi:outer membrane protein OmpA-like peptidoglycan-associated protein